MLRSATVWMIDDDAQITFCNWQFGSALIDDFRSICTLGLTFGIGSPPKDSTHAHTQTCCCLAQFATARQFRSATTFICATTLIRYARMPERLNACPSECLHAIAQCLRMPLNGAAMHKCCRHVADVAMSRALTDPLSLQMPWLLWQSALLPLMTTALIMLMLLTALFAIITALSCQYCTCATYVCLFASYICACMYVSMVAVVGFTVV